MNRPLLHFYAETSPDANGRWLSDILAWSNTRLERQHDYIQWLFPLAEPSNVVPDAPLVDANVSAAFRREPLLRANLLKALRRMLQFYGLHCDDEDPAEIWIEKSDEYADRQCVWLTRGNHNYRRLTRILRCLTILGCAPYAIAFLDCLERIYRERGGVIGTTTLANWRSACGR